ncbi:MAG: IS1595 family transposase [Patescibacteria group bacterium]
MSYTIRQFNLDFPSDNACLDYIFDQRYGKDLICPKCHKQGFHRVSLRKCYACAWCGHQIHPLAGTIFHKSSTKLTNWFYAIFVASQSRNGVAAKELQRTLGVTYKCAWRMAKKIRELMKQNRDILGGIIEADETYIGGRAHNENKFDNKSSVIGAVERKGRARVKKVDDISRSVVIKYLQKNISPESHLMTDESSVYKKSPYKRETVNHHLKEYVRGNVHTNSIEGLWSLIKRSIDGTYHCVSDKHLQHYLDEFVFHYNHRQDDQPIFSLLLERVVKKPS